MKPVAQLLSIEHGWSGADWLENNLAAHRRSASPKARAKIAPRISPFGRVVADLLGLVWRGIYHLPSKALETAPWDDDWFITVWVHNEVATYDGCELTLLVVAAHDACVRVSISSYGPRLLQLGFSPRRGRDGLFHERHPTLEGHAATLRKLYKVSEPAINDPISKGSTDDDRA